MPEVGLVGGGRCESASSGHRLADDIGTRPIGGTPGRRAKVLQFAATHGGGLATHVLTLAQGLSRDKYEIRVLCPDAGELRRRLEQVTIAADYLAADVGMNLRSDVALFARLLRYLRRHR